MCSRVSGEINGSVIQTRVYCRPRIFNHLTGSTGSWEMTGVCIGEGGGERTGGNNSNYSVFKIKSA